MPLVITRRIPISFQYGNSCTQSFENERLAHSTKKYGEKKRENLRGSFSSCIMECGLDTSGFFFTLFQVGFSLKSEGFG